MSRFPVRRVLTVVGLRWSVASSVAYARERGRVLRICDATGEARTLRLELLEAIRRVVGFDAYAWLVTDPETAVGCAPLADVPCLAQLPQLIHLKYLTTINRWTTLPGNVALLAGATGGDRNPLLACVHLSHGRWLTLRAGRIGSTGPPDERDIAVSIEETSTPERLALFTRAFGLSPREAELLRQLAAGGHTRDLARQMFVSEHTVQDYLKSIFTKTSVRSRGALLSPALGT
jgi:DNA-binding CsgD family transcriptional regulator